MRIEPSTTNHFVLWSYSMFLGDRGIGICLWNAFSSLEIRDDRGSWETWIDTMSCEYLLIYPSLGITIKAVIEKCNQVNNNKAIHCRKRISQSLTNAPSTIVSPILPSSCGLSSLQSSTLSSRWEKFHFFWIFILPMNQIYWKARSANFLSQIGQVLRILPEGFSAFNRIFLSGEWKNKCEKA